MTLRQRIPLAVSVLLTGFCTVAHGQADRHRIEYPVKPFALTRHAEELGLEYYYFGEEISRESGGRVRYSNHYFREYFLGRVDGYAYHPRFIDFTSELKLGLTQQRLRRRDSDGEDTSSSNDELLGYNIRVDLFKEHPVSGTLAATRDERILMGLFVDRYLVKTETERGTIRWNTRSLQMDLTAIHSESEEFGSTSRSESSSDSLSYNLHHQLGERVRTDLRYTYQEYERHFRGETTTGTTENESSIVSHTASLENRIDFLADRRATLRSTVRVHDQQNNSDLRSYFWQERLQFKHTDNLKSYLLASALRNEYTNSEINTLRGEAGLDHQLYKSLRTHFDIHGRRTDYGQVEEDRYGATLRLNYRKNTPAGVLSAGYARTLDQVDRTGAAATVNIEDEKLVINSGFPEFLKEGDVFEESIVVTDESNLITYTEGFDYDVVQQGRRTGLRVIPGGLLASGATVLVDYRIDVDGSLSYIADDQVVHIRHDFTKYVKGFSIYAQRHDSKARSVDSDFDPRILEYVDQSVGVRQELGPFAIFTEYQDYEDDLGGFNQWRSQVEGNHRLSRYFRAGWNAGYTQTDYESETAADFEDESKYYYAGANLGGVIGSNGFWRIEGRTSRETGRLDQTIHGVVARTGFDWRRLSLEGGVRYEEYDVFETERNRVEGFVSVKWRFTEWLRGGRRR